MAAPDDPKEAASKLTAMTSQFKSKSDGMLKEMQTGYNASVEAALKAYATLQSTYLTGYEDVTKQTKKANDDMLKNLGDNMRNLKSGLQSSYDTMTKTMNDGYEKAITSFKAQTEASLKQYPNLSPGALKDAINTLNNQHKATLEANAKRLRTIMENLDKRYKILTEQVTIPALTVPKLAPVVMKGGDGAGGSVAQAIAVGAQILGSVAGAGSSHKK